MARKKDEELNDESLDAEGAAKDEEATEDDDLLPEAAAKPPRGGGSGAFIAIVVVFIVILLGVAAYLHREKVKDEADRERTRQRQVLGTQLGRVKDNVAAASKRIDADPPDIEGAIEALNTAADQLQELALSPSATKAGLADKLVSLQGQIRTASQGLSARNDEYLEQVANAQRELKTAALREVKPLTGNLSLLVTGTYGDVDTPLVAPGVSSVEPGEGETGKAPEPGTEAKAETKTENP